MRQSFSFVLRSPETVELAVKVLKTKINKLKCTRKEKEENWCWNGVCESVQQRDHVATSWSGPRSEHVPSRPAPMGASPHHFLASCVHHSGTGETWTSPAFLHNPAFMLSIYIYLSIFSKLRSYLVPLSWVPLMFMQLLHQWCSLIKFHKTSKWKLIGVIWRIFHDHIFYPFILIIPESLVLAIKCSCI